jgi:hypothetical protein
MFCIAPSVFSNVYLERIYKSKNKVINKNSARKTIRKKSADKTITKRKGTKRQIIISNAIHRKIKIE